MPALPRGREMKGSKTRLRFAEVGGGVMVFMSRAEGGRVARSMQVALSDDDCMALVQMLCERLEKVGKLVGT